MDSCSKHFELDLHFIRDQIQQHQAHFFTYQANTKLLIFLPNLLCIAFIIKFRHKVKVECDPTISLRWILVNKQV